MSDKIRILHIIKTLGLGGAEVNLLNLLQNIDRDRFDLHVAYSVGGELEPKFKQAGTRLFKYADEEHKVKSLASLGIVFRIARYIVANKIQIVHTHNFSGHIWGTLAAKFTGSKVIEHVHDFRYLEAEDFKRRRGFNQQYRFINYLKGKSDKVIVLTRQNMDFLVKNDFYLPHKVVELQNGIPILDSGFRRNDRNRSENDRNRSENDRNGSGNDRNGDRNDSFRRELGLKAENLVVFTPVRLSPEKNVDLILRIAATVAKEVPGAVFLIAGDGPLAASLKKEVEEKGLQAVVRFIGFRGDIKELLGVTDVFLLPSFLELHSIAILEAMSIGVPVVVSNGVGCNDEFIWDWKNGVLLDPFKDDGWAEALIRLLRDGHLREKIGKAGLLTCREKFDIRLTVKSIEKVYDSSVS